MRRIWHILGNSKSITIARIVHMGSVHSLYNKPLVNVMILHRRKQPSENELNILVVAHFRSINKYSSVCLTGVDHIIRAYLSINCRNFLKDCPHDPANTARFPTSKPVLQLHTAPQHL